MYKGKKIAIVIPAYNEESLIQETLENIPEYADRVYVIDDGSTDRTRHIVEQRVNGRIKLVCNDKNGGVGAAVLKGYSVALNDDVDIIVKMDGDNQMDSNLLPALLQPLIEQKADYTKGNRLSTPEHRKEMPSFRKIGNFILTFLTRIASGYWHISDPQNGFTAITKDVLTKIPISNIYKGFAFENDMLIHLNIIGARVLDINHPARYKNEKSKINYKSFIIKTSWILLTRFIYRLYHKIQRFQK